MENEAACAGSDSRELLPEDGRFHCPFPECTRSFAELWRLKVHYRAPPDVRGSGKERGHGTELSICPKCWTTLKPGKHHVGCSWGKTTQRKRLRQASSSQLVPIVNPGGATLQALAPQVGSSLMQMQPGQQWVSQQVWQQQQQQQQHPHSLQQAPALKEEPSFSGLDASGNYPTSSFEAYHQAAGAAPQAFPPAYAQQSLESAQQSAFAGMPSFPSPVPQAQSEPTAMQQVPSLPQQQSRAPPSEQHPDFLDSVFDDEGELNYIPSIPSPPHLPKDFLGASSDGPSAGYMEPPPGPPPAFGSCLLFNFGQFSQPMPSQGNSEYKTPPTVVLPGVEAPEDASVLAHDDGDIMHLLFGLPDELPTMSTIHVHKWISRSGDNAHMDTHMEDDLGLHHHHHALVGSFGDLGQLLKEEEHEQQHHLEHETSLFGGADLQQHLEHSALSPVGAAPSSEPKRTSSGTSQPALQTSLVVPSSPVTDVFHGDAPLCGKLLVVTSGEKLVHQDLLLLEGKDALLQVPQPHSLAEDFLLDTVPRAPGVCLDELQLLASAE